MRSGVGEQQRAVRDDARERRAARARQHAQRAHGRAQPRQRRRVQVHDQERLQHGARAAQLGQRRYAQRELLQQYLYFLKKVYRKILVELHKKWHQYLRSVKN